mgnify:CR=1 FL=1
MINDIYLTSTSLYSILDYLNLIDSPNKHTTAHSPANPVPDNLPWKNELPARAETVLHKLSNFFAFKFSSALTSIRITACLRCTTKSTSAVPFLVAQ